MKLRRLELMAFKRFRQGFVLDDLAPGLNIFVGANEAGKSTVATALRAAFLERFKTSRVGDFAPEGASQARPTVIVDFDIGTTSYHLSKTFLLRPRCELRIGEQRLQGEQAEDALAALLGFEYSLKGQSKPAHAGVPGLLWMTQGSSQNVVEPALHAGAHLRDALTRLSGELAATDGDQLFQRVAEARAALLDARNGRPKGRFREATDALAQARQVHDGLQQQRAAWEGDVDRLAELRQAHAADAADAPWAAFEQQAEQACAKLSVLAREREAVEAALSRLNQARATVALLAEHVARDQADQEKWRELVEQGEHARVHVQAAQAHEHMAHDAMARASAVFDQAVTLLAQVRQREADQEQAARLTRARQTWQALVDKVEQAQAQADTARRLAEQARQTAFARDDLQHLRRLASERLQCQVRARAAATRIDYTLVPGQTLRLGDDLLSGQGEAFVLAPKTLALAGVGELHIVPGGEDLSHVAQELERATQAYERLCATLGVSGVDQAESRALAAERAAQDAAHANRLLGVLAPEGLAALTDARDAAQAALAALQARVPPQDPDAAPDSASAPDQDAIPISLADATAAHERAGAQRDQARDALHQAMSRTQTAQAHARWLADQQTAREAEDRTGTEACAREARAARLQAEREGVQTLQVQTERAQAALQAQRPDLIEQDVQRWERSARVARDTFQARAATISQLQGKLEQAGTQGVGEACAVAWADVQRLDRRLREIDLRARALTLLYERLGAERQAATQRLFAPLARRLTHYLNLLFPQATVTLGNDFTPSVLQRGDAQDPLASLSFGTQEQLGVLTRLAYADVLQEAGRPTLVVLDDALVHTDDARRELLKRALFDAATRHQILMLTCHGQAWRDMGVILRRI